MRRVVLVSLLALACTDPAPAPRPTRTWKFHALAGVSMGAIGTSLLAGEEGRLEKLDAVGMLGGPFDAAFMLQTIERSQMGGFCPYERLVDASSEELNDPDALTDCGGPVKPWVEHQLEEDFNHWAFTANGGHFDRDSYVEIFYDLGLALGNPLFHNAEVPAFAPGLTPQNLKPSLCDHPVVLEKFHNAEHNPQGLYPVISFCDGQPKALYCSDAAKTPVDRCSGKTPAQFCKDVGGEGTTVQEASEDTSRNPDFYYARMGVHDPCWKPTTPVSFGLAVDFNRNGRRDFHEPIISNAHERFRDVGEDGCESAKEDGRGGCTASGATGDPNGDDFEAVGRPLGTENDGMRQAGEPYEDFGLDGVDATTDLGERNGQYDESDSRKRIFSIDLRRRYLSLTPEQRRNVDLYADGGIRDVFNFGLSADALFSAVRAREPAAQQRFTAFEELPPGDWNGRFNALKVDASQLARNMFLRYGKPGATTAEIREGDGGHVGTTLQALYRFVVFFEWLSQRWTPVLGELPEPQSTPLSRHEKVVFFSEALQAKWNFEIALPAAYDLEPERRFPVLVLGHGYGMDDDNMAAVNAALDVLVQTGNVREMIVVYPNGRCCFRTPDGGKDCRRLDDDGSELKDKPGYVRECSSGSFYVNRAGAGGDNDRTRYGDAIFELMDYVDAHYRVLAPRTTELAEEGTP